MILLVGSEQIKMICYGCTEVLNDNETGISRSVDNELTLFYNFLDLAQELFLNLENGHYQRNKLILLICQMDSKRNFNSFTCLVIN